MNAWYLDGESATSIDIDDRLVQYGDGLFETIAVRQGRPRLWDYHVERLQTGCDRLGLPVPDAGYLARLLDAALRGAAFDTLDCTAKLLISAGPGPRGYRRPESPAPRVLAGVFESRTPERRCYVDGVTVRICNLRLAEQVQLAGIKSANRLEQVLARGEWSDPSIFEGLLLDAGGRLICGTMSNVFLATDNGFVTPAITRCGVSGVMRRHLLTVLAANGQQCEVRDIATDELWQADAVFLTNTHIGCIPVRRCGDQEWLPGTRARELLRLLAENGVAECRT